MEGSASHETSKLRLATFNADGLKSNIIYVTELLTKCDVLLLQEHWLHRYEEAMLEKLLPNFNYHIKCYDDDSLVPPLHGSKGRAGVMVIWHPNLNHVIRPLPDGSTRMIVLQINGSEVFTIINTYMPADGSRDKDLLYEDVLDEVHTVFDKYSATTVIWGGDINGSLSRRSSHNDRLLQHFCNEQELICPSGTPNMPTYHHFSGNAKSTIDMFLVKSNSVYRDANLSVRAREATNIGPHDPVIMDMDLVLTTHQKKPDSGSRCHQKINWNKVDMVLYKELTGDRLTDLKNYGFEKLPPEVLVSSINDILRDSAYEAVGGKTNVVRKHRTNPWSKTLKPLIMESKQTHFDWKQNKADPLLQARRKAATKLLRKAQRTLAAKIREEEQTKIMSVQTYDKQEYFKLIAKQRGKSRQQVAVEFGKPTTQLEGFREYFQGLATPCQKPDFDCDYYDSVTLQLSLVKELNANSEVLNLVSDSDIQKHVNSLKNGKAADIFGISAEHLKHASAPVVEALKQVTNNTLRTGKLVPDCKLGVLTPVPKPGKDPKDPDGYRRITVCSIVGKVIEK